jgi:hypothetical protein
MKNQRGRAEIGKGWKVGGILKKPVMHPSA